ncbi:MAG: hypothetical protein IJZ86_01585 [Bacteroides sp.]|nr:hypothetical protein [Bacteroides sp.]
MNKMKCLSVTCLALLFSAVPLCAQEDLDKVFEEFDKENKSKYEEFKNKADAEFETFLRETWEKYNAFAPVEPPVEPKPVKPTVLDKSKPALPSVTVKPAGFKVPDSSAPGIGKAKGPEIHKPNQPALNAKPVGGEFKPSGDVQKPGIGKAQGPEIHKPNLPDMKDLDIPEPGIYVPGKPYVPVMVPMPMVKPGQSVRRTEVEFYGTTFEVATTVAEDLVLGGNRESHVANAWKFLCQKDHEQMVADCRELKQKHQMSDWMYLLFTKQIGTQLYGADHPDEIVFLQMFLLSKSGYKVRLAKNDEKLKLMIATAGTVYSTPYLKMGDDKYYVFEPTKGASMALYTYRQNFADAKNLVCLNIDAVPVLEMDEQVRTLTPSTRAFKIQTTVNKNLLNLYRDYAKCDVVLHYRAPMSDQLRDEVYEGLKREIEGKSQKDAANILINFVQTAFEYQTDGDQFGYEKPFFPDETFFYPYCDCEDRAMLFSTLVKDLLGLDAVLLDYPGHIASAVHFTEDVKGDALILDDGTKYVICDPTYIGASIGMCMPNFKTVNPEIIR